MKNDDSFVNFKNTLKSVIIDNEKFYVIEGDILMDEQQIYTHFLRTKSIYEPPQKNKNDEND